MGDAEGGESDESLVTKIREIAGSIEAFTNVYVESTSFWRSEDFTHLMRRVQVQGESTYVMLGSELQDNHRNPRFDLVETNMMTDIKLFSLAAVL